MYNAMQHIRLNDWKLNPEQECISRYYVEVLETLNDTIVKACINAAKEAGINDLYLLDKQFVLDALREKAQKMRSVRGRWIVTNPRTCKCSACGNVEAYLYNYCPECGAKMDAKGD